ncbi:Rrf2 family transcriptional regulator [Ignavibacteriales bacterium]
MIFSKKCEYGLQTVLLLSTLPAGTTMTVGEISGTLNIPKEFTGKILQQLTNSELIDSKRGNGGGFSLSLPASQIKMIDIINALDGLEVFNMCVLGFNRCNPDDPCPVHDQWNKLRETAWLLFSTTNLEEVKEKSITKIKNIFEDEIKLRMIRKSNNSVIQ